MTLCIGSWRPGCGDGKGEGREPTCVNTLRDTMMHKRLLMTDEHSKVPRENVYIIVGNK